MKLYRVDAQDYEDLIRLWPLCHFASPADAASQFEKAYPHAPDDPGLVNMIADIERAALSRDLREWAVHATTAGANGSWAPSEGAVVATL